MSKTQVPILTMAIVTDIHHGKDRRTKLGSVALPLLKEFSKFVSHLSPDVIVEMGDRISDEGHENDLRLMSEIGACIKSIPGEWHHLLGNHDIAELNIMENAKAMQCSFGSHSINKNGFHLVFWDIAPRIDRSLGFFVTKNDLKWLKHDLDCTELPTVIFSHVPLDNGSMKGNFYFEKLDPYFASYSEIQGEAIRSIIESSGKVILCLNGHTHWNAYHCIDGIHYVTIPSLTEGFATWPDPAGSFARVTIETVIDIEVHGLMPITYKLPIRKRGQHWVNLDKPYSPHS